MSTRLGTHKKDAFFYLRIHPAIQFCLDVTLNLVLCYSYKSAIFCRLWSAFDCKMLNGKLFVISFLVAICLLETISVVEGQGFVEGLLVGALL